MKELLDVLIDMHTASGAKSREIVIELPKEMCNYIDAYFYNENGLTCGGVKFPQTKKEVKYSSVAYGGIVIHYKEL